MTNAQTAQTKPVASKNLTVAQAKHLSLLVAQINSAQIALDAAQKAKDVALSNADNFLIYCAEENEIALGVDGWTFAQNELRFVQMPVVAYKNGDGN